MYEQMYRNGTGVHRLPRTYAVPKKKTWARREASSLTARLPKERSTFHPKEPKFPSRRGFRPRQSAGDTALLFARCSAPGFPRNKLNLICILCVAYPAVPKKQTNLMCMLCPPAPAVQKNTNLMCILCPPAWARAPVTE